MPSTTSSTRSATAGPSAWAERPVETSLSAERLAALVDRTVEAADSLLFTATPREELDGIGQWQRLKDLAFFGQLRAIVTAHNRIDHSSRDFVADEVALAINASPTAAAMLTTLALSAAALPGLLEAGEAGMLTERHLRAVVAELHAVELTAEQRCAVVLVLLARLDGQTPGELVKVLRRLVLQVDAAAAKARHDKAVRGRAVTSYGLPDGMAALHAVGPAAAIAAVQARLRAEVTADLHAQHEGGTGEDERTRAQREFDLLVDLLTHGTVGDQPVAPYEVQVLVPFSTAAGGDLELAELPGYGPVLPQTARDLLEQAASVSQVALDPTGTVFAVSTPVPGPRVHRDRLLEQLATPPDPREHAEHLGSSHYRPSARLVRVLQARDRTCVFPGCGRRATDKDHRVPWPLGPTSAENLQCLCRHHHRAKQAVFTTTLQADGTITWTTRGGWTFPRRPQRF